jgi:6,7-dimethyl-8-ribityllumazine synthase
MAVRTVQLQTRLPRGTIRVAIIVSRYNDWITDRLRDGAIQELERVAGDRGVAVVVPAPGSFELVHLSAVAAASGKYHAVVALGCLIKGETSHDRIIADAVAQGIAAVSATSLVPVAFGVLTVDATEQAEARAGGDMGNKGVEAMSAALETLAVKNALLGV